MRIKRLALILLFALLITGRAFADLQHKVDFGPPGNLYHSWLDPSTKFELKFSSSTLTEPQTLFSFTRETTAYDLDVDNTKFYLAYSTDDSKVYSTYSKDNGYSFSAPILLTDQGSNPSIAIYDDLPSIAWEEEDGIYFSNLYEPLLIILITGETLSSPSLSIDDLNKTHLAFLSKDSNTDINKVMYTALPSPEPIVLFESYDDIINLGIKDFSWGILLFWQKEYMQRRETYFCVSLDGGRTFGREKRLEFEEDLLGLYYLNNKLSAVTLGITEADLVIKEMELPPLPIPEILYPSNNTVSNGSNLKLTYTYPGADPFVCKIDLSQDQDFSAFKTQSFGQFVSSFTREVIQYDLPVELPDGICFLRMHAFDGTSHSPDSQTIQFRIDNIPPRIQTLEAQREEKQLTLKGEVSESPAWLTINDHAVSLEASFEREFILAPGKNIFTLVLTDEAGNVGVATKEVFYDPALPELTILKPSKDEWFKPDSVILFEVEVYDLQEDIYDEAEAEIWVNNQRLEDALTYDQEESTLFGFVSLPAELTDGTHTGTIILSDKSGNKARAEFTINIDGSPPAISCQPQEPYYTKSQTSITFLVEEEGAGIDPSGTFIMITGMSIEGAVSAEAQKIILTSDIPLPEGTYEAEIITRDQIGNVGEPISFSLVVDTTPPKLTLIGSYESSSSKNKIIIRGKVEEKYPRSVNIYNNQEKIESLTLSGDYFSKEINLFPGSNDILVEVSDKADNTASAKISTFTNYSASASSLIQNCVNGPNPFSPSKNLPGAFSVNGKGMVFSYSLAQPADIKIRIYNLIGTLIWTKDIRNTASGVTAWSGIDAFGQLAGNGIYPYIFSATSGNSTEMKKGKIIIIK